RSDFVKELMSKKDVDLSNFVPELVFNRLKSKFIDK
ncbi:pantetheine-phosphate adenylyltransferase, partial [Borreliella americana]|nr:pantetheine-phosphate adenylyltransferase [Borreliella americana]